jgi:hypothetical protein
MKFPFGRLAARFAVPVETSAETKFPKNAGFTPAEIVPSAARNPGIEKDLGTKGKGTVALVAMTFVAGNVAYRAN